MGVCLESDEGVDLVPLRLWKEASGMLVFLPQLPFLLHVVDDMARKCWFVGIYVTVGNVFMKTVWKVVVVNL